MQPVFNLFTTDDLFYTIEIAFKKYKRDYIKDMSNLLFIIMELNHLPEWIDHDQQDHTFSNKIRNNKNYNIINDICNCSKHAGKRSNRKFVCQYGNIDDCDEFDSLCDLDRGPVIDCFIEDINKEKTNIYRYYKRSHKLLQKRMV